VPVVVCQQIAALNKQKQIALLGSEYGRAQAQIVLYAILLVQVRVIMDVMNLINII
jgi:hypothetical protein